MKKLVVMFSMLLTFTVVFGTTVFAIGGPGRGQGCSRANTACPTVSAQGQWQGQCQYHGQGQGQGQAGCQGAQGICGGYQEAGCPYINTPQQ